jgi:hypothetical protein
MAGAAIASSKERIENGSRFINFVNNTIKVPAIFLDLFQFFGGGQRQAAADGP